MAKTSNTGKDAWNASHYSQIKVCVNPALAAAFKESCAADGVSMARDISEHMERRIHKAGRTLRIDAIQLATRGERRKSTALAIRYLEKPRLAEETYMENIPENLRGSSHCENAEAALAGLDEAIEALNAAYQGIVGDPDRKNGQKM